VDSVNVSTVPRRLVRQHRTAARAHPARCHPPDAFNAIINVPLATRPGVLKFLAEYEQNEFGYELLGRRGWALPDDVADALGNSAKELLVQLAGRKALDRIDISTPGTAKPTWIYRINARGAAEVGLPAPAELGPPSDPPPLQTVLSDAQWMALQVLRDAKREASPTRFLPPEIGWRTAAEVTRNPRVRAADIWIYSDDYGRLIRLGLVELRRPEGLDRARTHVFYRATDTGDRVERLEKREPSDDTT
jgi:hypothetical protein